MLRPLNQSISFVAPQLVRVVTVLTLLVSVFVTTSFRFGESPELASFPLIVPTVSYGLEHERFDKVEIRSINEELSLRQFLKQAGVAASTRKAAALKAREQVGSERFILDEAHFFYNNEQLNFLAIPLNEVQYLRIDLVSGKVVTGDMEGIQSEFVSTTMFFNGDVDSTLKYTLLAEDLQQKIRKAFVQDMPLDTGFHAGVVKVIYTEKQDKEGVVVGYGEVEALRYSVNQEERTSIRFVDNNLEVEGFFNPDGSPVQQSWLTSPIPGARMSSAFNLRRRHPVLKRIKPHYGTDYAAPYGTPILAVSDGMVVARDRNRGNGNYIKIRHNSTYQSQYLHMKGFASGMKPGAQVKKGQVIGYVGSTGLSNGPHVCFRFWKNGKQVDHRKEDLKTANELTKEAMTAFQEKQAELRALLDVRA